MRCGLCKLYTEQFYVSYGEACKGDYKNWLYLGEILKELKETGDVKEYANVACREECQYFPGIYQPTRSAEKYLWWMISNESIESLVFEPDRSKNIIQIMENW